MVFLAKLSGQVDAVVEGHAYGAHQQADDNGKQRTAEEVRQLVGQSAQGGGKGLHLSSSPEKELSYSGRNVLGERNGEK